MAQVVQRTWRSGPRKVRRVAWGYTPQIDGKQIRKYDAAWSKDDAEQALAARLLNVEEETSRAGSTSSVVTFKAKTERYLQEKEISKKRSIYNLRKTVQRLLAHFGGETPLVDITAPRIAEYRITRLTTKSERTGRDLKRGSLNRELSILRAILRLAADEECGYLEKAPKVRLEREEQGRLRFLSDDEYGRLMVECRKSGQPLLSTIVVIALNTGMRKSEILGLEWERIDVSRGVLQLEETKNGTRREIPMNQAVYDVLSAPPKSGRRLFPSSIRRAFENAVERAGVKDLRFHDLRHTFASWLVMRGRPLLEVKELLGHRDISMTMRYAHLAPERLRDAVAALDSTTSAHKTVEARQIPVAIS